MEFKTPVKGNKMQFFCNNIFDPSMVVILDKYTIELESNNIREITSQIINHSIHAFIKDKIRIYPLLCESSIGLEYNYEQFRYILYGILFSVISDITGEHFSYNDIPYGVYINDIQCDYCICDFGNFPNPNKIVGITIYYDNEEEKYFDFGGKIVKDHDAFLIPLILNMCCHLQKVTIK